jgi:hypothetical protein
MSIDPWADLNIVGNPAFARARPRRIADKAEVFFARTMYAVEQMHRDGVAITPRNVHAFNENLPETLLGEVMASPKFAESCLERGIPLSANPGLGPEQLTALAIYSDMTVPMTHAQKLRAAGVTEGQWRGWMRQPEFAARIGQLMNDVLHDSVPVAKQRLAQHVDAGNLPAITLLFEMEGVHDRRKETVDVNALLMGVFSILDEEIGDIEIMTRIANKIRQQMMGQGPILTLKPAEPQPVEQPAIEEQP